MPLVGRTPTVALDARGLPGPPVLDQAWSVGASFRFSRIQPALAVQPDGRVLLAGDGELVVGFPTL